MSELTPEVTRSQLIEQYLPWKGPAPSVGGLDDTLSCPLSALMHIQEEVLRFLSTHEETEVRSAGNGSDRLPTPAGLGLALRSLHVPFFQPPSLPFSGPKNLTARLQGRVLGKPSLTCQA
jgi:hypothetical protein